MRSRVVRVDDVCLPFTRDSAQLAGRPDVPFSAKGQPISRKTSMLGALDEWRASRRNNQGAISQIAKTRGKEKYLALAAAPAAPGIDVNNPG
jgi:hypothetical protein